MKFGNSDLVRQVVVAWIASLFVCASTAAAKGMLVQPSRFYLTADPGGSIEASMMIAPASSEATAVTLSVVSFVLDENGQPHRCAGCAGEKSLSDFIEVIPTRATLRNGDYTPFTIRGKLPPNAHGTYWAAIGVETDPVDIASGQGERSLVTPRVSVPIFVTSASAPGARIVIESLRAMATTDAIEVVTRVRNLGETVVRAPLAVSLERADGRAPLELAMAEEGPVVVLPHGARTLRFRLKGGDFGDAEFLRVHAFVSYGSGQTAGATCGVGIVSAAIRV